MRRILGTGFAVIAIFVALLGLAVSDLPAQEANTRWGEPANLSTSGSGDEPFLVSDSAGTLHVIWQDATLNSYVYNSRQGDAWAGPHTVELPFGTRSYYPDLDEDEPTPLFRPQLVATALGQVQALWLDDEGNGYHSRVNNSAFADFTAWTTRTQVMSGAAGAALWSGPDDRVYVAYIQNRDLADAPAGLYFRRSSNRGTTWSAAVPLYTSPYFRLFTAENANVQLVIDAAGRLSVAWDHWPEDRVMFTHSVDDGGSWAEAVVLDQREDTDGADAIGPSGVRLAAYGEDTHVTWHAGHDGAECSHYHRWSSDGGAVWQDRRPVLENMPECPAAIEFIPGTTTPMIFASTTGARFLTFWAENQWQPPVRQPELTGFEHPQTFREVSYLCGQKALGQGEILWVISCGESISSDVWAQSRPLNELIIPPAPSVWQAPEVIESGENFVAPVLAQEEDGRLHAFWTQPAADATGAPGATAPTIRYSQQTDGRWSRPADVLTASDGANADPAVALTANGVLLVTWRGGPNSEIYVSRVSSASAALPSEWTAPVLLSPAGMAAEAPDIAVDGAGNIYVAYAVSLNERRGVYLVRSDDGGLNWSNPVQLFDGAAAGWERVGAPRLAAISRGVLHALWLRQPISGAGVGRLYYAASLDGGNTWSTATEVTAGRAEAILPWYELAATESGMVHRLWHEWSAGHLNVWHQVSADNGRTWPEPEQVLVLSEQSVPTTLTMDEAGRLHLLYVRLPSLVDPGSQPYAIGHWYWQEDSWRESEAFLPAGNLLNEIAPLAAAASTGQLAAIFAASGEVGAEEPPRQLYYTMRALDLPPVPPQPALVIPTETAVPVTPTPSPTATPEPTATVVFPRTVEPQGGQLLPGALGQYTGLILASVVVLALVLPAVLLLQLRRQRAGN